MSFETQDQKEQVEENKPTFNLQVGDRTYDSEDAVKKKIEHADSHISTLEQELADAKARLERAEQEAEKAKVFEEQLTSKDNKEEATTKSESVDVERLVEEKLSAMESKKLQEDTFASTQKALIDRFGAENLDSAIAEQLEKADAGITLEDAIQMASDPKQSKLLLKVLGEPEQPTNSFGQVKGFSSSSSVKTSGASDETLQNIIASQHGGKLPAATEVRGLLDSIAREMGHKAYDPKV